ncbi:MAG: hypothetical protein MK239_06015 [Gemmatimonadetes bacterium]|nr:hypothetical protein [Gemmatimonadota bacterium]
MSSGALAKGETQVRETQYVITPRHYNQLAWLEFLSPWHLFGLVGVEPRTLQGSGL